MVFKSWPIITSITLITFLSSPSVALPPAEDTPEEILRTEIITEGRSPLDNQPLSASEYEQLKAELAESKYPPQLNSKLRHIVFLLQLLKFARTINPFQ
jgi:hypothetical protein